MRLSMKKLEILKKNIKFLGGLLGLKDFLMILELLLLRYGYCKISRKRSKPDKHGHGNGIECARAGRMLSKGFMGASTNLQGLEASPDSYK
ncbi:hypothetical protein Tco_0044827 [Tanacetum coccineum]